MKISSIIRQQICQLKWYILACIGIIMILPIENALVDFKEGYGFQSASMDPFSTIFAPLLAGLIACANIQGDLQDKRYTFWRSKPAGIKKIMSLKYFVGLIISLFI